MRTLFPLLSLLLACGGAPFVPGEGASASDAAGDAGEVPRPPPFGVALRDAADAPATEAGLSQADAESATDAGVVSEASPCSDPSLTYCTCPPGALSCVAGCLDLQTSGYACGACGATCLNGTCTAGRCRL